MANPVISKHPADAVAMMALTQPEKVAVKDAATNLSWSYAEFDKAIARLVSYLQSRQYGAGERIVVLAKNSVNQVLLHFACSRLGLVFAPLNWRLAKSEIHTLLDIARPALIVTDVSCAGLIDAQLPTEDLDSLIHSSATYVPSLYSAQNTHRASVLLFTSGTTSKPKGVLLSEHNLLISGMAFSALSAVSNTSCFLCEAPMFHVIGLVANIRPALQQGGSIILSDGFNPARTLAWLANPDFAVTHYIGVPQMIEALRQQADFSPAMLRGLTALVTGGAPHNIADLSAWLAQGIPIVAGFGMSEAGTVLGMPPNRHIIQQKLGSVGVAAPWFEIKLVDDDGLPVGLNQPGELWIRSDSLMLGYFEDEAATTLVKSPEGWFKSGDILRCDEDGFYWVVDRKKDMYISGGENIYPAELEAHLADYPGLIESAVIGITDPQWGEVGCVVVVPAERDQFNPQQVLDFLLGKVARYKIPKKVVVLEKLPRTSSGKLQKTQLKHMLNN